MGEPLSEDPVAGVDFSGLQRAADGICETLDRVRFERDRYKAALAVVGVFLANVNSTGNHQGFNRACRAVEEALGIASVSECRRMPVKRT